MGEENKTRDAVDAVTGLVKAVPIYQDVVQPAAKEVGVGLQKTVRLALAPISVLVWGYDQIEEFVKTSVAERLEKIPPEQIQTPLPEIAGPALEALKYTGHNENLRELFAKLLATAMDKKAADQAHPSFVEAIRQLSSDEAKICRLLKKKTSHSLAVNVGETHDDKFYRVLTRNFSTLGYEASCDFPKKIQQYLDNLISLRIIQAEFGGQPVNVGSFTELETHPDIQPLIKKIIADNCKPQFERGVIIKTNYGGQFLAACVD
ncbi:MAG: DUF4393 domain-containing protein [Limisphaerales bacterium]